MEYIAYLHKDRKSDFGVSFPDFPGCVTAGKTLQEAQRLAAEALSLHVEGMIEDGEEIPEPSTLDALVDDVAREDAVVLLVHIDEPGDKLVRINITGRESQIEEIDRLARKARMNRSAYMVQKALEGRSRPPVPAAAAKKTRPRSRPEPVGAR
jgi:predicted RNase H-like HicB family nuclease